MTSAPDSSCLICRILAGEIPADVVHETATTLALRDIEPQAPTHVLVVPRRHVPDIAALVQEAPEEVAGLFSAVAAVAEQERLTGGYRSVFNTGADAHQTVFHAHVHVLGGRSMAWPPG